MQPPPNSQSRHCTLVLHWRTPVLQQKQTVTKAWTNCKAPFFMLQRYHLGLVVPWSWHLPIKSGLWWQEHIEHREDLCKNLVQATSDCRSTCHHLKSQVLAGQDFRVSEIWAVMTAWALRLCTLRSLLLVLCLCSVSQSVKGLLHNFSVQVWGMNTVHFSSDVETELSQSSSNLYAILDLLERTATGC